ncbi:nucleolar protein 58-like [Benincasa hispida]|uniref:nucleolar protein 58-like n=1 Tax=Benincasa hispida TaxID=102211 RepID=UPI0019028264|nr:nucleolar protein 58-like [Benincasa hispida]
MEEASSRSALAVSDPKETIQTESYEGPIRVALEEAVAEKQPEMAKEKKKKIKEKRAEGDEEAQPRKEKKERKTSERREHRQAEKHLKKKEEKRKRVESSEVDRESTTARVDDGVLAQQKESAQLEEETMQIRTVATDDGEDSDITPLCDVARRMCRKSQQLTHIFYKVH